MTDYLLLEQGFTLADLGICSNYGVCEAETHFIQFENTNYKKQRIMMCARNVVKQFDNESLFLMVHLDRDEAWVFNNMQNRIYELENRLDSLEESFSAKQEILHPRAGKMQGGCFLTRLTYACKAVLTNNKKAASLPEAWHD